MKGLVSTIDIRGQIAEIVKGCNMVRVELKCFME
jgi:hypothetical protein